MSTVYNAPVSTEAAALLGTDTKPSAKAIAAKVAARAKAKQATAPAKPATKAAVNAKIDAILGHGTKAKAKPVAKPTTKAKPVKTRKAFTKYDAAFCAKVVAFVKGGKSFSEAKREFGCSAHWVSRLVKAGK